MNLISNNIKNSLDYAWLGLGDISKLQLNNPLIRTEHEIDYPGLREIKLMQNPDYVGYAAKTLFNIDLLPEQMVIEQELWKYPFPMLIATRGAGKTFLLALYCMLKMVLSPTLDSGDASVKIVLVGGAFRQSKLIFEYMETLWRSSPIFRSLCDNDSGPRHDNDRWTFRVNGNWTYAIPLGDGQKIRGLRANIVMADEFSSISTAIYEVVIQGFLTVASDPMSGVKYQARENLKKKMGLPPQLSEYLIRGNQMIISGTADYDFKHFASYWKKYCSFIKCDNDVSKLKEQGFGDKEIDPNFDSKSFCVIRIPYELIPKGFMDDKIVARAKATVHSGVYNMEFGAVFSSDSTGFFKRSLIESCVASDNNINTGKFPHWCPDSFDALTRGNQSLGYVYGIDPASEADNFSIVVLEVRPEHQRVVYCWTTNRDDFKKRQRAGLTTSDDFYGFCARKIRDLMTIFPSAQGHALGTVANMDAQGGGIAVLEALHDSDKMKGGELPIWPIIDPDKKKDTDDLPGLHILDLVQFARADWTSEANHGLRKDMEDKVLLFPRFDSVTLEMSSAADAIRAKDFKAKYGRELTIFDSLEDCVLEIEELKNELTTIVITRTGTGVAARDRWDTPEIKLDNGKKGRLRKDRYSALLMANMVARQIQRKLTPIEYEAIGGFVGQMAPAQKGAVLYNGPSWFTDGAQGGFAIKRG